MKKYVYTIFALITAFVFLPTHALAFKISTYPDPAIENVTFDTDCQSGGMPFLSIYLNTGDNATSPVVVENATCEIFTVTGGLPVGTYQLVSWYTGAPDSVGTGLPEFYSGALSSGYYDIDTQFTVIEAPDDRTEMEKSLDAFFSGLISLLTVFIPVLVLWVVFRLIVIRN